MEKSSRIFVAGHLGLAGSAILRRLGQQGYTNLITRTHSELDLEVETAVEKFFSEVHPEYVFLVAAKVGGIYANNAFPADFILRNLKIQNNVIEASWRYEVKGLLFPGSSCSYPRLAPQPIREDFLLSGYLEPTNEPYAIAKIAGIKLCESFNRQHGTRFLSVIPASLYGPSDNFDMETSHVLPALIRKFHVAKLAMLGDTQAIAEDEKMHGTIPYDFKRDLFSNSPITLWGTGTARREFLYSDDMADACIFLMSSLDKIFSSSSPLLPCLLNIGCGEDLTIRELAKTVGHIIGYNGHVSWDASKPDGMPQKLLDVGRMKSLGWVPSVTMEQGIRQTYRDYLGRL